LVLIPGAVLTMAAEMGFRGIEFATLISIFATPCAVAGFVMAQQMDSDADLAGNCVVFTSALSCLTIFCWIVLFKEMGVL
ncbi:MAG: AEC family transporter, partial [Schwartzia sp.]|nr:AEC family transporter [Schwartzia sp. (in: firmicutes)]